MRNINEIITACVRQDENAWEKLEKSVDGILTEYIKSSYPNEEVEIVKKRIWESMRHYAPMIGEIYIEVTLKRWLQEII